MRICFGIGTNLGDREKNLRTAVELLTERVGEQLACSSVYKSAPQGFVSENEFANIVVICETGYSPEQVLLITQEIEREMGRREKSVNGVYHDRVIDIDLLQAVETVGGEESTVSRQLPTLTLPHPRMHERDFVMIPLCEVERICRELDHENEKR